MVSPIGDLSRGGCVPSLLLDLGRAFTLRHSRHLLENPRLASLLQGLEVLLGRVPRRVVSHLGACFVGFAKSSRRPPRAILSRRGANVGRAGARVARESLKFETEGPRRASRVSAFSCARGVSVRVSRNGAASCVRRTWRFRARSTPLPVPFVFRLRSSVPVVVFIRALDRVFFLNI